MELVAVNTSTMDSIASEMKTLVWVEDMSQISVHGVLARLHIFCYCYQDGMGVCGLSWPIMMTNCTIITILNSYLGFSLFIIKSCSNK